MDQQPTDADAVTVPKPLRILCLDGGGIKGYTSLLILKRLFREIGFKSPDEVEPKPCEVFDLIVGTSTGGLIAAMLGRLEFSIDECLVQYPKIGKKIFPKKRSTTGKLIRGMLNVPYYDIQILQEEIKSLVETEAQKRPHLQDVKFCAAEQGQSKAKVLLCVTRTTTRQPDALRSYKTQATTEENYDCDIWEATSATSAAPIYFAPVKFSRGAEKWSDGGLRRNNPINEACNEIARHREFTGREIGCIVSIGTGHVKASAISSNLAKFLKQAADMMTESEETADAFAASEFGLKLAKSKRYFRFNVQQGLQEFEMDELREMEELDARTTAYLRKQDCAQAITECAESLVNPEQRCQISSHSRFKMLYATNCNHYCHRNAYTQTIVSFFDSAPAYKRFVLWGTGGMGKTQLALEYAQLRARNDHVFWIRCEQYASTLQDLGKLTTMLDPSKNLVQENANDDIILRESRRMLEGLDRFLLVLDNADDFDQFLGTTPGSKSLTSFLPEKGDVLITTRDPRFLGGLVPVDQGIRVTVLEREEARLLLEKSVPSHLRGQMHDHNIEDLLDQLGGLPLAICQAAANIRELQIDLPAYVRAYTDQRDRILVMQAPFLDHTTTDERNRLQSIHVTWQLSFKYLEERYPLSAVALQVMSLLNWSGFALDLLSKLQIFRDLTPAAFRLVISKLHHLSLIEECSEPETFVEYSVHPIVHEMIFHWLKTESPDEIESLWLMIVNDFLDYFPFVYVNKKDESHALMRYLLPHAARLVQVSVECDIDLPGSAILMQHTASFMSMIMRSDAAAKLSVQAVDYALRVWFPDDVNVYFIRKTAVECLTSDARYADAEGMAFECLHMLEYRNIIENLEPNELLREKSWMLSLYASTMFGQDKIDELYVVYRDNIRAAEAAGFNEAAMRPLHHNLANNLCRQQRFAEARVINDKLLEAMEMDADEYKNENVVFTGSVLNVRIRILENLAQECNNPAEAAVLRQQMTDLRKKVYISLRESVGASNLDFWKAANNLMIHYIRNQRLGLAADIGLEVLDLGLDSDVVIQGQFLETFRIFVNHVLFHLSHFVTSTPQPTKLVKLTDRMKVFIHEQELSVENLKINALEEINSRAVHLQWSGRFAEAEELHRFVVESSDLNTANLDGLPYYNLMLAIAQQPGRLVEAYKYRDEHLTMMEKEESIYGSLDQRLQRWKEEREIYDEAKKRIEENSLIWTAQWCQDHRTQLQNAQRRWGWLFNESNPVRTLCEDDEALGDM